MDINTIAEFFAISSLLNLSAFDIIMHVMTILSLIVLVIMLIWMIVFVSNIEDVKSSILLQMMLLGAIMWVMFLSAKHLSKAMPNPAVSDSYMLISWMVSFAIYAFVLYSMMDRIPPSKPTSNSGGSYSDYQKQMPLHQKTYGIDYYRLYVYDVILLLAAAIILYVVRIT